MADLGAKAITLIDLTVRIGTDFPLIGRITNAQVPVVHDNQLYTPAMSVEFEPSANTGDFSTDDYVLKNLERTIPIVNGLAMNLPYPKVEVAIRQVFYPGTAEQAERYLFRGFVYQAILAHQTGLVDVVCKDWKYYMDTTAGVPCTELCAAAFFGDPLTCKKTVLREDVVVASVDGTHITLTAGPLDTTPLLFNRGYMKYDHQIIDIRHHNTGTVFDMCRVVPSTWEGQTVALYAGCDKSLDTCRNVHDNEERFLGLGIAMPSYNPFFESP